MRMAFTLVELLTVLAIMALVASMVVYTNPRQGKAQTVELVAEGVAGMLRKARAMAIVEQAPITVSFNLQNAPGSSGRVINNRSGGHWLRLLRPARMMITGGGRGMSAPWRPR